MNSKFLDFSFFYQDKAEGKEKKDKKERRRHFDWMFIFGYIFGALLWRDLNLQAAAKKRREKRQREVSNFSPRCLSFKLN